MQEHDTDAAGEAATLRLTAPLTIRRADEIAETLLGAIEQNKALLLDLPEEGPFDISFLQVIEAARIHAREQGKTLALTAPVEGMLLDLLDSTGFLASPTSSTFWTESGATQ
jgi:anti-anti-sigma regulatory factor